MTLKGAGSPAPALKKPVRQVRSPNTATRFCTGPTAKPATSAGSGLPPGVRQEPLSSTSACGLNGASSLSARHSPCGSSPAKRQPPGGGGGSTGVSGLPGTRWKQRFTTTTSIGPEGWQVATDGTTAPPESFC